MSCTSFHSIYFMPLLPQSRNSELLDIDIVQVQDALNLGATMNSAADV